MDLQVLQEGVKDDQQYEVTRSNQINASRDEDCNNQVENFLLKGSKDKYKHTDFLTGGYQLIPDSRIQSYKGSKQSNFDIKSKKIAFKNINVGFSPVSGKRDGFPTSSDPECFQDLSNGFDFLPGGGFNSDHSENFCKGSKQISKNCHPYYTNESCSNLFIIPDTERNRSSSNPKLNKSTLESSKDRSFLHKVGTNYYKSKINNQIYHLSCWDEGDSSGYKLLEADSSLKRSREVLQSILSKQKSGSEDDLFRGSEDRVCSVSTNPNTAKKKFKDLEDFVWKPP